MKVLIGLSWLEKESSGGERSFGTWKLITVFTKARQCFESDEFSAHPNSLFR